MSEPLADPEIEPDPVADDAAADSAERLGAVIAVGLAFVGLLGALLGWRVVQLGDEAGGASASALAATRERNGAVLAAEAEVADSHAAWLAYELSRRRAIELRDAGHTEAALREDTTAAAHWGFVDGQYVGPDDLYRPEDHSAGVVARFAERSDLGPEPHLAAATAVEDRALGLTLIGVLVAAALPFLTLAEVARGRFRLIAAALGGGLLAVGAFAVVGLWG
jgi:hypothetical protein